MPLRESTGKWQYRFKIQGVLYEKVTAWEATETNRKRAEAEETRHRDGILRGDITASPTRTGRRFNEVTEEFMNSLAFTRIKSSSVQRIKISMVGLRVWFRDLDIGKIDARAIEAYKTWRLRGDHEIAPVKPITLRHDLAALSKFFRWATTMKIVVANPVRDVEKPSDPDGEERVRVVTDAEQMDFFDRCERRGYRNLAEVARLMLEQGMRPEEAMTLEKRGIDLERGYIKVFRGKTKAAKRTLKMTAVSREIISKRIWENQSRWLFPTPKITRGDVPITKLNGPFDKVRREWAAKGDQPARPSLDPEIVLYSFRHTYATRMAERGMPLGTLKSVLGHSSLRMVMKYVHPTQDHMDAEITRIDLLMHAEREAANNAAEGSILTSEKPN